MPGDARRQLAIGDVAGDEIAVTLTLLLLG